MPFIISAGMAKSGSSLLMQYQSSLIKSTCTQNGFEELRKHMKYGHYTETIDEDLAALFIEIERNHGPFSVKTHCGPNATIRALIDGGFATAIYSFRDLRDCALSALDHAKRTRAGLIPSGAFAKLTTISDTLPMLADSHKTWKAWNEYDKVMMIRYEDMMMDKLDTLAKMSHHFNINASPDQLKNIYDYHESVKKSAWNFNKGTTNRWLTEMSAEDLALCEAKLSEALIEMGYALSDSAVADGHSSHVPSRESLPAH